MIEYGFIEPEHWKIKCFAASGYNARASAAAACTPDDHNYFYY